MRPSSPRTWFTTVLLSAGVFAGTTLAQEPVATPRAVEAEERAAVVTRVGEMLAERYVFEDIGRACGAHVQAELDAGAFADVTDPETFARMLTEALQSVSHDKHMRVRVRPPQRAQMEQENPARARARRADRSRQTNYGFAKVERLDGNVGYLDMRYFDGSPVARPTAVAAMNFLANADALIFDMRQNGGGSPEMIRFICSYLFDEPTHLNSLYYRAGDRTEEFWTLEDIPGPRLADVPAFVLTSSYTFSGAEEFSYNLKTRKRATLIGEITGGGANPGGTMPINDRFGVFIPTGRAINPVTGTNWEGVGVVPDIEMAADDAYDTAVAMASEAAETRRGERVAAHEALWADVGAQQAEAYRLSEAGDDREAAALMAKTLGQAHDASLVGEPDINMIGYELLGRDRIPLAIAVFEFNVEAYPDSGNVYDSLAEAYMTAGDNERAIRYYRKSLEVDPTNANAEQMIETLEAGR